MRIFKSNLSLNISYSCFAHPDRNWLGKDNPKGIALFHSAIAKLDKNRPELKKNSDIETSNKLLHPYFITGFTDGDGSFMIQVFKNKTK